MYMAPNVTEVHEIEFPKLELAKGEFNPRLRKCDHGVSRTVFPRRPKRAARRPKPPKPRDFLLRPRTPGETWWVDPFSSAGGTRAARSRTSPARPPPARAGRGPATTDLQLVFAMLWVCVNSHSPGGAEGGVTRCTRAARSISLGGWICHLAECPRPVPTRPRFAGVGIKLYTVKKTQKNPPPASHRTDILCPILPLALPPPRPPRAHVFSPAGSARLWGLCRSSSRWSRPTSVARTSIWSAAALR